MLFKKLDEELNLQQAALRIRSQRQELLASNIANADTPQYKAKDIDFKAAMQSAMQQMSGKNPTDQHSGMLQQTNESHLNAVKTTHHAKEVKEAILRWCDTPEREDQIIRVAKNSLYLTGEILNSAAKYEGS